MIPGNFVHCCFSRLLPLIVLLSVSGIVSAQTLIAGTSFDPVAGKEGLTFIGLDDIKYYGPVEGSLRTRLELAGISEPDSFHFSNRYSITNNPEMLDHLRYQETGADHMYVYSLYQGTTTNFLRYHVYGMRPNSTVTVKVVYCNVAKPDQENCMNSPIDVFASINFNYGGDLLIPRLTASTCDTFEITGTADFLGNVEFALSVGYHNCAAIGVKSIEVYGELYSDIYSAQGNEICTGEQIILDSRVKIKGSYQWQVDTSGVWHNLGNFEKQMYELKESKSYDFRVLISPEGESDSIVSNVFTVTAASCMEAPGKNGTRSVFYFDDFGRVDLDDMSGNTFIVTDYTDILNPVERVQPAAAPFRRSLENPPSGTKFAATGPVLDSFYTVAALLTGYAGYMGYDGAFLEWSNALTGPLDLVEVGLDHSGNFDGAALLVNHFGNSSTLPVYSKTLTGLPAGEKIYAECWISVFTSSASGEYEPVYVTLKLTDSLNTENSISVEGSATREADGGGEWVRLSAELTLSPGSSSLNLEILNNLTKALQGNDLALDDIKVMIYTAPSINLFFDESSIAESIILSDSSINLVSVPSEKLKAYYGESLQYLFQWTTSPEDHTSWQNLGSPSETPEVYFTNEPADGNILTITETDGFPEHIFDGLQDGDKIYFRVIAATQDIFAIRNDPGPFIANKNDPLRDYSVSEPIEAILALTSCIKADDFSISSLSGDFIICPDETVTLSVGPLTSEGTELSATEVVWYKDEITPGNIVKGPSGVSSDTWEVGYELAGKYLVRARDAHMPDNPSCYTEASVTVQAEDPESVTCSTVTGIQNSSESYSLISPNPATERVFLGEKARSVKIYNSLGELVLESNKNSLSVGHLTPGIYILLISYDTDKVSHQAMVKQ